MADISLGECRALAWVLKNPVVTAPIVGATKVHHLADAVKALDVTLTADEIRQLEEPYQPHLPSAFRPTVTITRERG
jgi:1-deoxyxylulose-5-phosphate synthase